MIIQWYPGHMTKAFRLMEKEIKIVDVILYVLDSRAPFSCVNPKFESLVNGKPIIYVFNKYDMADKDKVDKWITYFKKDNIDRYLAYKKSNLKLLRNRIPTHGVISLLAYSGRNLEYFLNFFGEWEGQVGVHSRAITKRKKG